MRLPVLLEAVLRAVVGDARIRQKSCGSLALILTQWGQAIFAGKPQPAQVFSVCGAPSTVLVSSSAIAATGVQCIASAGCGGAAIAWTQTLAWCWRPRIKMRFSD